MKIIGQVQWLLPVIPAIPEVEIGLQLKVSQGKKKLLRLLKTK
jgi:hypothetical protein